MSLITPDDVAVLNSLEGWLMVVAFALVMFALTLALTKRNGDKEYFLLANRSLPTVRGALSITASWVWAPALLVSAEMAYQYGFVGLLYFSGMNTMTFFIFIAIALIIRKYWPGEFTLPHLMKERHSGRVHKLYLIQFLLIGVLAMTTQLTAGAAVVNLLTGIPFWQLVLAFAGITLTYSLYSGLGSSVLTDWVQMTLILSAGFLTTMWIVSRTGVETLVAGLAGADRGVMAAEMTPAFAGSANPFSMEALLLFWFVGLTIWITHFSGMVSDQSFWQRSWGTSDKNVAKSFGLGGIFFIFVPATFGTLGLLAAGSGAALDPAFGNHQLVHLAWLVDSGLVGTGVVALFGFMIMAGLMSTVDSQMNSVGSIVGHDLTREGDNVVSRARLAMVGACGIAVYFATFGIPILDLFLLFGALRAVTVMPTWLTALKGNITETSVFWSIVIVGLTGIPAFAAANAGVFTLGGHASQLTMLYVLFGPGILVYVHSALFGRDDAESPASVVWKKMKDDRAVPSAD